ncbi:MAG: TetR family transcriptional regulator [Cryobacterium sp.]|nr:TetR family transcriptional regulator [Cryobacterium sp.]
MTRRKAATRSRIITAADRLFTTRGYANTSMEDIADAADIAIRTIYLHFPSKAAIHLASFDSWLDAFVLAVVARPIEEPVADAVTAALQHMTASGWDDHSYGEMPGPHPTVEFLGSGPPEIAGHIMHSWVRAQDEIARDAVARGGFAPESLHPRARAAAVFAAWVATLLVARDGFEAASLPSEATGNTLGGEILRLFARDSI